jgi:hypothetical protein
VGLKQAISLLKFADQLTKSTGALTKTTLKTAQEKIYLKKQHEK